MNGADVAAGAGDMPRRPAIDAGLLAWIALSLVAAVLFLWSRDEPSLTAIPPEQAVPIATWIQLAMDWFTVHTRFVFRGITWFLGWPLEWLRDLLQWLPWFTTVMLCSLLGFVAAGWRLALFCAAAMMYMVVVGYWEKTAYTLALAGVAVPIALVAGLAIGILGFRSKAARRVIDPALDLMQTVPTFAYLIPILVLFGIGPVVGMVASAIYAIPPMVRNVMLGLERVPVEMVESAKMSGSTRNQMLKWVQLPAAMPTILIGVNQTIMAGLSMVVIAAMVGGAPDIGLEVFTTMKKAQFGESLLSGLVIALLAMIMDRISRGFAGQPVVSGAPPMPRRLRRAIVWTMLALALAYCAAAVLWPDLRSYPNSWVFYPAQAMNRAVEWFTINFFWLTNAIKSWVIFYLLLPLKMGMLDSVRPRYWGFEMGPVAAAIYAALVIAGAILIARLAGWRAAVGLVGFATVYFFGTTNIPWPVFILAVALLGYQTGGWKVALFAIVGLLFIVITGVWESAMVSVQLCAASVAIAFFAGTGLGIWAATNDRVSATLRPINDTLQTMPIFVFLIPAVMVFLVGEFTALVAVVLYAIVPSIRYTEHGIRNAPPDVVEAARALGATRRQLLWQVKIPLALPEIMLGLNQTIMLGLAMVIVAALVGAKGLGQEVMVALTWNDTGYGAVSGLSVAILAIVTDRIIQSWSRRKKAALGLA